MNTDTVIAIFIAGGISFGWGWYRGRKDGHQRAQRVARDTLEVITLVSVLAEDKTPWTHTGAGQHRARIAESRMRLASKGRPLLIVSMLPSETTLENEVVIDLYPTGVPR